jgi:3-isopropylmalate/(R)-2-methylmalate dehydratase large subunit
MPATLPASATTVSHRRDHAGAHPVALRRQAGALPLHRLQGGDATPIAADAVPAGGFQVVVAGTRYGKGSSREHSPAAEKLAGIRLVIAESFERIYRQNADNIGLFTSTDFGLVERIQRGEAIALDELVAGRDALAAAILRSGGLLRFGQQHLRDMQGRADEPDPMRPHGRARCSRRSCPPRCWPRE